MDCQVAQNLLCSRLDREITPEERDALELHTSLSLCRGTATRCPSSTPTCARAPPASRAADTVAQQVVARLALPVTPPRRLPVAADAAVRRRRLPPRGQHLSAVGARNDSGINTARSSGRSALAVATGPVEVMDPGVCVRWSIRATASWSAAG
jgi:hypothetical protein